MIGPRSCDLSSGPHEEEDDDDDDDDDEVVQLQCRRQTCLSQPAEFPLGSGTTRQTLLMMMRMVSLSLSF